VNDFSHHGRKEVDHDRENGPGTHDEHRNFGYDSKYITIGSRLGQSMERFPGPGTYEPEKADPLVRKTSPSYTLG